MEGRRAELTMSPLEEVEVKSGVEGDRSKGFGKVSQALRATLSCWTG